MSETFKMRFYCPQKHYWTWTVSERPRAWSRETTCPVCSQESDMAEFVEDGEGCTNVAVCVDSKGRENGWYAVKLYGLWEIAFYEYMGHSHSTSAVFNWKTCEGGSADDEDFEEIGPMVMPASGPGDLPVQHPEMRTPEKSRRGRFQLKDG